MALVLFTIGCAVINALVHFSGNNVLFSKFTDHGKKERKRCDLVLEKLQRAIDEGNELFKYDRGLSSKVMRQSWLKNTMLKFKEQQESTSALTQFLL